MRINDPKDNSEDLLSEYDIPRKREFRYQSWIALGILWVGIIFSLSFGIILSPKVLIATIITVFATILMFVNSERGILIVTFAILIGVFGVVHYAPFRLGISFGIGSLKVWIDVLLLTILVGHYLLNKKIILADLSEAFKRKGCIYAEEQISVSRERVNEFKNKFKEKSLAELEKIAKSERHILEARLACKELIDDVQGSARSNS